MHKVLGAILLLSGFLFPAVVHVRERKRQLQFLEEVALSLEALRRHLMLNGCTMEVLLEEAENASSGVLQAFYHSIQLDRLDEQSFQVQWKNACKQLPLEGETERLFLQLGQILGQYDLEEQCNSLHSVALRFHDISQREGEQFPQEQKLWLTLSASAGMLAVILLL